MANSSISSSAVADIVAVYDKFVSQCDAPDKRTALNQTLAFTFFTMYTLGVPLQLCILPANIRLAKHRSAFLLLLYINVLDVLWLLQYIWLCVEFMVGKRLLLPLNAEAYLFRVVNFCIDAIYIQLAVNRALAVLDDTGLIYQRMFDQKNNKIYLLCIFTLGILYSIYTNWIPQRRVFHCMTQLSYFEPTTSIPTDLLATLPDTTFYDAIQHIYVFCIYLPTFMYSCALIKLIYRFFRRRFTLGHAAIAPANTSHHHPIHSPPFTLAPQALSTHNVGSMTTVQLPSNLQKANAQFANFALERSRLFLLCFCSQVPYLLANGFHLFRSNQIDEGNQEVMAIFWQFFGTVFHVQQPVLMLLLSRDMRRGVREDFSRLMVAIRG